MADRRDDSGGRDYDWLFGQPGQADDDATRRIPVAPRPDRGRDRAATDEAEHTRVLPSTDRPWPSSDEPPPPRAHHAPARLPRRRHPGRIIAVVLVLLLAFFVGVPLWAWSQIAEVDAEPSGERPPETPGTTYLLVGSDSREGLSEQQREELSTGSVSGGRADTIMLLHAPRFGGPTLLLSFPRDSIVQIPGRGEDKLNAAYAYGGADLLVTTVESETGLRVDNYVQIGLGGFASIVEAIGGVEICPENPMDDPEAGLDIPAGCQQADGATALGYARSRKADGTGDIARNQRQREVLGAIADKAASPWSVLNPVRYFQLLSAGAESLAIGENVGPLDLARFAWGMSRVTGADGLTCSVPIVDLAVHWDEEEAAALFEQIARDDTENIECSRTGGL